MANKIPVFLHSNACHEQFSYTVTVSHLSLKQHFILKASQFHWYIDITAKLCKRFWNKFNISVLISSFVFIHKQIQDFRYMCLWMYKKVIVVVIFLFRIKLHRFSLKWSISESKIARQTLNSASQVLILWIPS